MQDVDLSMHELRIEGRVNNWLLPYQLTKKGVQLGSLAACKSL